jgi:hypothetical protein
MSGPPAVPSIAAALAAAVWLSGPAALGAAEDEHLREVTSEALPTGGLALPADGRLQVRAEALFISRGEIGVRYEVVNTSGGDLDLPVAFPMPELSLATRMDSDPSVPDWKSANFLDAAVSVDGRAIAPRLELTAFAGGVDRSEALRARKVPLNPFADETGVLRALGRLPPQEKQALIRLGLATEMTALEVSADSGFRTVIGQRPWIAPSWSVRTRLVWIQRFPAGKPVRIALRYRPSVGLSPNADCCVGPEAAKSRLYCAGPDVAAAVAGHPGGDPAEAHYSARRIAYSLSRERGPIGVFRLVVDKQDEADLVSFCDRAVRKTGAIRFEVTRRDFRPGQDLAILFLKWNRDLISGTGP